MARRSATDLSKRYAQIRKNIEYLYKLNGKSINEVAEYVGLCDKTLRKRLQDPKQFTISDIDNLANYFNVSADKIINGRTAIVVDEP